MHAPDAALPAPETRHTPLPTEAQAMKRRLLERVADADTSHLTVGAAEGTWRPLATGVWIKLLYEGEGMRSCLLRLAPGASLPPHRHPADEECVVLQGALQVGSHTEVGAGGYHRAHRGALHPSIAARDGATVFLRGALPAADHALG
jgi:quercetin dioxygenase-like cupin family protein